MMKKRLIIFIAFFIAVFSYSQEYLSFELLKIVGVGGARYVTEDDDYVYFVRFISDERGLYKISKKDFTREIMYDFVDYVGSFDNGIIVRRKGKRKWEIIDIIGRNSKLNGYLKYLPYTDYQRNNFYFQNNIFFGSNNCDSGSMGVLCSVPYKIDLETNEIVTISKENWGFGVYNISDDKQHVLIDKYYHITLYNTETDVEKTITSWEEDFVRRGHGFLTNKLIYSKFGEMPGLWKIYTLDGDVVGFYKIKTDDGSIWRLDFFNNNKNAVADELNIVDTTPLMDNLRAKGALFIPRKGTVAAASVTIYKNANREAPVMGSANKAESVEVLDESGAKSTIDKKKDYWYKIKTSAGITGWVFGGYLKLLPPEKTPEAAAAVIFKDKTEKPVVMNIFYSNYLAYSKDYYMYHPVKILDGDQKTGWLESSKGQGIGDYIEIELDKNITVDEIEVSPGYFHKEWWEYNNRVKDLIIKLDNKEKKPSMTFRDEMTSQRGYFLKPLTFKKIRFEIKSVYPSKKDNDTSIAEIKFYYKGKEIKLDLTPVKKYLKKVTEAEVKGNEPAVKEL